MDARYTRSWITIEVSNKHRINWIGIIDQRKILWNLLHEGFKSPWTLLITIEFNTKSVHLLKIWINMKNQTSPSSLISFYNKRKINDFSESHLSFAINIQKSRNLINKPNILYSRSVWNLFRANSNSAISTGSGLSWWLTLQFAEVNWYPISSEMALPIP